MDCNGVYRPREAVYILSSFAVVGREEKKGPLGEHFHLYDNKDDSFGMESWEMAESEMQRLALDGAFAGSVFGKEDVGFLLAGDLQNQCVGSSYGLLSFGIPYLGLYGACSTAAEGILLTSLLCGTTGKRGAVVSSSHNCSAERQFRFPMEYGGQRTPTSQWTVTGAGAFIIGTDPKETKYGEKAVRIAEVMPGIAVDMGITDVNNMGAAMAPAAADTLTRYFENTGKSPRDFDMILTGDLGKEGAAILREIMESEGITLGDEYADCGMLIYGDGADMHAGGSGCGCSAVVLAAVILKKMRIGELKNVILVGTGALMNPLVLNQGMSIPGIGHLVHLTTDNEEE